MIIRGLKATATIESRYATDLARPHRLYGTRTFAIEKISPLLAQSDTGRARTQNGLREPTQLCADSDGAMATNRMKSARMGSRTKARRSARTKASARSARNTKTTRKRSPRRAAAKRRTRTAAMG
jgi:hypothetical protein